MRLIPSIATPILSMSKNVGRRSSITSSKNNALFSWKQLKNRLILGILITLFSAVAVWLLNPQHLPIVTIRVEGSVRTDAVQLQSLLAEYSQQGFLYVSLSEIETTLTKQLPWIKTVSVGRQFPDTLVVKIVEHQPIAYWQQVGWVTADAHFIVIDRISQPSAEDVERAPINTAQGTVVSNLDSSTPSTSIEADTKLPRLVGVQTQAEAVVQRFRSLQTLLTAAGLNMIEFGCNRRLACYAQLTSGVRLLLGKKLPNSLAEQQDNEQMLQRGLNLYRQMMNAQTATIKHIDLRHTNGIVVRLATAE